MDTFIQLDDNDFTRLKLTTKMIKIIQRVQREYKDQEVERVEEDPLNFSYGTTTMCATTSASYNTNTPATCSATDPNDPYQGINLDEVNLIIVLFIVYLCAWKFTE